MSIKLNVLAPTAGEPGAQVQLDASRSFNAATPFNQLTYAWSQTAGAAGELESADKAACFFHVPTATVPGDTFTFSVTVSDKATGETATGTTTLAVVRLIGRDQIKLTADVTTGSTLFPRGPWTFNVNLTAPDGSPLSHALLRQLSPARLYAKVGYASSLTNLPIVVWREHLDHWRVFVEQAPAGERLLEIHTEQVLVQMPEDLTTSLVRLRRPAAWIENVIWLKDGADPELIQPTRIKHTAGSTTVQFHESYTNAALDGSFNLVEVRYYSLDAEQQTGWYAGLGLTPFDDAQATLFLLYGEGPWVDPALDPEGRTWDVRDEAVWSAAVRLLGTRRLRPYYHIWKREGDQALLREPYEGILRE
jgi:hypothetical protein